MGTQKGRHYKKKSYKNKQAYLVGAILVTFTLIVAVIAVYLTAEKTKTVTTNPSAPQTSTVGQSSDSASDVSDILEENQGGGQDQSSEPTQTAPKYPSIAGDGEYALTAEEIAEIEAIITKAEAELYYDPSTVSSSTSSEVPSAVATSPTSSGTSSKKEMKPPPEKRSISIFFEDIQSGYTYSYNADRKYFVASLIKAPYSMYLYTLAESGKCDLEEKVTVELKDLKEGTGNIRKKKPEEFPLTMTVRELMSEAIRSSDNTAMEKLRKKFPDKDYAVYAKSLGLKYPNDIKNAVNASITATDAGVYAKAIYNYIQNGKYGNELYTDMINTTNPLILSQYKVARKYGWAELSFHDMAVVYAKSPYTLSICTDATIGKKSDYKLFADLSRAFEKFHQKRYP